ncbi:MAG TPA: helix-turn-helix domain-containing protein, partial [Solirubrobacteraceae bacterium]|nr:helix-turn-helix domain-containing protein [Solirubrobacteraceae bacterium]
MSTVQPGLEAVVRQQLEAVLEKLRPGPLAEEMADLLLASIPELVRAGDEDFRAGLLLSCESNVSAIWSGVLTGASLDSIAPPAEAIAWSHELVHRGVELPALLRAYRLGHGLAERRLEEAADQLEIEPEMRWRVLSRISHHLFAYIDAVCTDLVDDYEQERAQWIRGAAAARAELVSAIVDRHSVDARAATEKLRYDITRDHVAMIVWGDPPRAAARVGSLEREATSLAAALGGGPLLTVPIGERAVWAWTSGEHLTDDPAAIEHTMGDGVRAAIGTCRRGLAGMADSHDEARVARRVAELRAIRPGTVVGYRTADLTALLTADPVEAVRFAESELGELLADSDAAARLRATVRVYLEENLSPARAARRLGIHQNTVVYRVKQTEQLLGHAIEPRRLQIEVALRLSDMIDGLRSAADRGRRTRGGPP